MLDEVAAPSCALPRSIQVRSSAGDTIPASLRSADQALLERVNQDWHPLLDGFNVGDAAWDWASKNDESKLFSLSRVERVVLMADGVIQGVMITSIPENSPFPSQLPSVLYVEYIAIAPHNRAPLLEDPAYAARMGVSSAKFKGIGAALIGYAIQRSYAFSREGRLGLHSVPDNNTIASYQKLGLVSRGPDPNEEFYQYFEGDSSWAEKFLKRAGLA